MPHQRTSGGHLDRNLHLGDDTIDAGRGEALLKLSLFITIDVTFETTTKKRPWETVRGVTQRRDEGREGSGDW